MSSCVYPGAGHVTQIELAIPSPSSACAVYRAMTGSLGRGQERRRHLPRSCRMRLLVGAFAYLAVVAAVIVAVLAGLSSIERRQPAATTAVAAPADELAAERKRAPAETVADPDRVPVWIAATTKYHYTPQAIDPPKRTPVIGAEGRGAMARAHNPRRKPERSTQAPAPSRGVTHSRRDNDPFFRD